MATVVTNGAEALTNGVTPTTGNSGGGGETAWSAVVIGAGATLVASTSLPADGSVSYLLTPATSGATYMEFDVPGAKTYAFSGKIKLTSDPTSTALFQCRSASGQVWTVGTNSTGTLVLQDAVAGTAWTDPSGPFPTGAWYRIEVLCTVGVDTSHGTLRIAYYANNGTTAIQDSGALSGKDCGTANITIFRHGKLTGTYSTAIKLDTLSYAAQSTFIGATGNTVPGAPTVGTATVGVGSLSLSFTAPGSNGGSAITSYIATASTGQTASGASSPLVISGLAAGTAVTAKVAAINAIGTGSQSAASNSVTPTAAGQILVPTTDVVVTNWVATPNTAPTLASVLDETTPDGVDYITSAANPVNQVYTCQIQQAQIPQDANGWSVIAYARFGGVGSTSATIKLELIQGPLAGTVINNTTQSIASGFSFQAYTLAITSGQAAGLTDLSNIFVRATVNGT